MSSKSKTVQERANELSKELSNRSQLLRRWTELIQNGYETHAVLLNKCPEDYEPCLNSDLCGTLPRSEFKVRDPRSGREGYCVKREALDGYMRDVDLQKTERRFVNSKRMLNTINAMKYREAGINIEKLRNAKNGKNIYASLEGLRSAARIVYPHISATPGGVLSDEFLRKLQTVNAQINGQPVDTVGSCEAQLTRNQCNQSPFNCAYRGDSAHVASKDQLDNVFGNFNCIGVRNPKLFRKPNQEDVDAQNITQKLQWKDDSESPRVSFDMNNDGFTPLAAKYGRQESKFDPEKALVLKFIENLSTTYKSCDEICKTNGYVGDVPGCSNCFDALTAVQDYNTTPPTLYRLAGVFRSENYLKTKTGDAESLPYMKQNTQPVAIIGAQTLMGSAMPKMTYYNAIIEKVRDAGEWQNQGYLLGTTEDMKTFLRQRGLKNADKLVPNTEGLHMFIAVNPSTQFLSKNNANVPAWNVLYEKQSPLENDSYKVFDPSCTSSKHGVCDVGEWKITNLPTTEGRDAQYTLVSFPTECYKGENVVYGMDGQVKQLQIVPNWGGVLFQFEYQRRNQKMEQTKVVVGNFALSNDQRLRISLRRL